MDLELHPDEIIVDNFAGGGGVSTGIEEALNRNIDVALNHSAKAIAMHKANHPHTKHLCQDIWDADPREIAAGRPIGLAWFSPDCTHFSKAKGGKPVKKSIRALAWVVIRWAVQVRPRVIILENVEEFQTWGPLVNGVPCKQRRGKTFKLWVHRLRQLGYTVEWQEIKACDLGAPTIRKRLYLVAWRAGRCGSWAQVTHTKTGDGKYEAFRTAANCIDWSIHCPSIFERKRPLAEATMRRIARGIQRFVIDCDKPFIVPVTHQGDERVHSVDEPLRTVTTAPRGEFALISPTLVGVGGRAGQSRPRGADEPTATGTSKADTALVATHLVSVAHGDSGGRREYPIEEPLGTVTSGGRQHAIVAASLLRQFGKSTGQEVDKPAPTVTAGGGGKTALVTAFMAQHNGGPRPMTGKKVEEPLSTITSRGTQQQVVTAHLSHLYSSNTNGGEGDLNEPARTVTAGGQHHALVKAFLVKYYGTATGQDLLDPLHSLTTKARFGLVTIDEVDYEIVDIGMRMLTPRELFRAQGFPEKYVIDPLFNGKPLTKTDQVAMCGNSVCPPVAKAITTAAFQARDVQTAQEAG